jgi:hypothetical protein
VERVGFRFPSPSPFLPVFRFFAARTVRAPAGSNVPLPRSGRHSRFLVSLLDGFSPLFVLEGVAQGPPFAAHDFVSPVQAVDEVDDSAEADFLYESER